MLEQWAHPVRRPTEAPEAFAARRDAERSRAAQLAAVTDGLGKVVDQCEATAIPLVLAADWNCRFDVAVTNCATSDATPPALRAIVDRATLTRMPFAGEGGGVVPPGVRSFFTSEVGNDGATLIEQAIAEVGAQRNVRANQLLDGEEMDFF